MKWDYGRIWVPRFKTVIMNVRFWWTIAGPWRCSELQRSPLALLLQIFNAVCWVEQLSSQHAGCRPDSMGGVITEFWIMADGISVAEVECLSLGTSGFISLEHLVSCDPFFINHFPEQGCPYSNKPLPLILPDHCCFIIYPEAYLLLSLNEVVSASVPVFSSCFLPQIWRHSYFHPLSQGEWIRLYL